MFLDLFALEKKKKRHDTLCKDDQISTKRKRRRNLFTKFQILELERRFHHQRYLSAQEREQLATMINLTANQVMVVKPRYFRTGALVQFHIIDAILNCGAMYENQDSHICDSHIV